MPTAFVTGATGFVGVNLVGALCACGWEVVALHRPSSDLTYLRRLDATLRVGTVEDYDSLLAAMPEAPDAVFHTAASLSWWRRRREEQHRTNVLGTRNVARAARQRGARRLIHTSSIAAFGMAHGLLTEDRPSVALHSSIGYLRTKFLAEEEVHAAVRQGLSAVILNPANIIGPFDLHNWSRSIRLVAEGRLPGVPPGGGAFCHVASVVGAHLAAVERGGDGERYILAGVNASYLEMFRIIGELLGKRVPRRTVHPLLLHAVAQLHEWGALFTGREPEVTTEVATLSCHRFVCSSAKAERELGYDASPTLEQMLRDCHAWMASEGLLPRR